MNFPHNGHSTVGSHIYIYEDERKEYVIFSVRPLADMGKDIIDANITFIWDYENHVYKKREIDWSQM